MHLFREKLRNWAMGLALFSMLLQALIPAAQAIPFERDDSGFDTLIICTAFGVQVLQAEDGADDPANQAGTPECPVCSVHSLKLFLPGLDLPAPVPERLAGIPVRWVVNYLPPDAAPVSHAIIRAPPAFSFQ